MGDAIDVGVAGPSAIVYNNARHGPGTLRLLSGCCSGGASFVVAPRVGHSRLGGPARQDAGDDADRDDAGHLAAHSTCTATATRPPNAAATSRCTALDASTILTEMRRGALDGAWLAEPWATRLVRDVGRRCASSTSATSGRERRFPTALVVARGDYAREHGPLVARLADAMAREVERASACPTRRGPSWATSSRA